jgi:DNA mismatch endonuclease (patch repair protein)
MANRQPADTSPEYALRRRLHACGLRFARTSYELPGRPDIVLPKRRSVIFVHGCFWHGHDCPQGRAAPKFHVGAWAEKITANRERDRLQQVALHAAGWHVETVWECQIEQHHVIDGLATRLLRS